jgi:hypothetical protein
VVEVDGDDEHPGLRQCFGVAGGAAARESRGEHVEMRAVRDRTWRRTAW